ncbi:MAG TPA: RNA 2',3'-cyclic phosphodiesterase [Gammaproteobacteria bacterium]|jgi:2'-5' RNA ligase|nr:RNA 2',3'-cyclic phosphodiesterase [Gammaproteobacteria bacterium]
MILPSVVRVFFAIALSENTKNNLATYIDSLKKISRSKQIRWSKPENLHITLQFLAEVKGEHIDTMIQNVKKEIQQVIKPFQVSLRSIHLFPDPHRPRVIVVDVVPQDTLTRLSILIGSAIQKTGYEIDMRPFRAHMTIGRIKTVQTNALNFLAEADIPAASKIDVNEVVLFQSEPHPDGSHYVPLQRIELA